MSDKGESKQDIEIVLKEKVNIIIDNQIEKVAGTLGIDIKPIFDNTTSSVTTVVSEGVKTVSNKLGLKLISESNLSEDQKELALTIYESVKKAIESFINDPNINNTIKITKTLGQVIKQLETAHIDGKVISGSDKKVVAIKLGRIIIKEVMPDDKGETEVLMMYDIIAEPTLEAMIDVSRVVNVAVKKMVTKCCPGFLSLLKKTK
jgi:iron only hydrogenase large subunit-like protein